MILRSILAGTLVGATGAWSVESPAPSLVAADLDDSARERFLLEAEVVRTKGAPKGVTGTLRATLRGDGLEHDASIQRIDEMKVAKEMESGVEIEFRDSYRNNVAAYRLDRLLGLGMVPVSVVRVHEGRKASFTWWVENVVMDEEGRLKRKVHSPDVEAWNRQMIAVQVFDQLIYNFDSNPTNLLIDSEWRIWMIDHSRGFKTFGKLLNPKNLGKRCPRGLLAGLRRLDQRSVEPAVKDLLSQDQVDGLLRRRDLIVAHFDKVIAELGEDAVLYDLPPRVAGKPAVPPINGSKSAGPTPPVP